MPAVGVCEGDRLRGTHSKGGVGIGRKTDGPVSNRAQTVRRRRLAAAPVILVVVGVAIWFGVAGGNGKRQAQVPVRDPDPIAAVESGLLPWRLPVAVSREVVLPGRRSQVVVLGGLSGSTSEPGVFSLDTRNGGLHSIGSLPVGVHDGAASLLGGPAGEFCC